MPPTPFQEKKTMEDSPISLCATRGRNRKKSLPVLSFLRGDLEIMGILGESMVAGMDGSPRVALCVEYRCSNEKGGREPFSIQLP